jgi:DNA-binding transcriptional MocR family regulator
MPEKQPKGAWVQTDRAVHEAWAQLSIHHPAASALLHFLSARVGEHNAVVVSQRTLADVTGMSLSTVKRAVAVLKAGNWVEVRQIGPTGTAVGYVLNDRVVWSGPRDGIRYSLFSAAVVVSDVEQPDKVEIGQQQPLRSLPRVYPGERQLPTGEGLPPPSQPAFPGLEPDLPTRSAQLDIEDFTGPPPGRSR